MHQSIHFIYLVKCFCVAYQTAHEKYGKRKRNELNMQNKKKNLKKIEKKREKPTNKVLHSNNNFPLKGDLRSLLIEFF